jgi:hypothetical protein
MYAAVLILAVLFTGVVMFLVGAIFQAYLETDRSAREREGLERNHAETVAQLQMLHSEALKRADLLDAEVCRLRAGTPNGGARDDEAADA